MARKLLKWFHPEGIPFPGSLFYNALTRGDIFQRHYALVAQDIVRVCPAGQIADLGTGPGWLLMHLRQAAPDLKLKGVDISPAMVKQARINLASAGILDLPVVEGAAQNLPFPDRSFEAVVSTGSLHHWKDTARALREIYRVLAPGGHALLYDIVRDTPREVLKSLSLEYGRVQRWLFWIHAFEEPFLSLKEMADLPASSPFRTGVTRFIGALCCLQLEKPGDEGLN